jgi:SHS2 domain-containing protein
MQEAPLIPLDVQVREVAEAVLEIELEGVRVDGGGCRLCQEIKAVTYHNVKILETEHGIEATVVLDV